MGVCVGESAQQNRKQSRCLENIVKFVLWGMQLKQSTIRRWFIHDYVGGVLLTLKILYFCIFAIIWIFRYMKPLAFFLLNEIIFFVIYVLLSFSAYWLSPIT